MAMLHVTKGCLLARTLGTSDFLGEEGASLHPPDSKGQRVCLLLCWVKCMCMELGRAAAWKEVGLGSTVSPLLCDLRQVPHHLRCYCCYSVAKSCPALCDPMDNSAPGLPVLHHFSLSLLKLMSTEWMMPSNHLILCRPFSSCPQSFPASGSFPMNQLFPSVGQSTGALASVPPMNIQG